MQTKGMYKNAQYTLVHRSGLPGLGLAGVLGWSVVVLGWSVGGSGRQRCSCRRGWKSVSGARGSHSSSRCSAARITMVACSAVECNFGRRKRRGSAIWIHAGQRLDSARKRRRLKGCAVGCLRLKSSVHRIGELFCGGVAQRSKCCDVEHVNHRVVLVDQVVTMKHVHAVPRAAEGRARSQHMS